MFLVSLAVHVLMLFAVFEFQEVFDRFRERLPEKRSDVLARLAHEKCKSGAFLREKLEIDTRERSSALAKPRDPGEAGETSVVAPVAPCGSPGFVLASVSTLGFPHLCRSAFVFPPVSRCSHGLACPPPRPHPEPGSAFSLSRTAHGCVCIRRTPDRRRFHFWSPGSERKCKAKQHFP